MTYEAEEALIHITYSTAPCSGKPKYNLPQNTVLWYRVILKNYPAIAELNWQKDRYERGTSPYSIGFAWYQNRKDGVNITTKIYFPATAQDVDSPENVEKVLDIMYMREKFACKK